MSSPSRAAGVNGFNELGLVESVVKAVTALGYEEPTPIQREAIPLILTGRDLLAQAATGTGKTAAFALPLIQRLLEPQEPAASGSGRARVRPGGLVLVPTRELAMQVAEAAHKYARGTGISVVPLYGGAPMSQQIRALERGVSLVVATPGRALDHIRRQSLDLSGIKLLVLDEADEMLDMGFAEDIDAILTATPAGRQTALFSATMPPRLRSIAERHLREPQRLNITQERPAAGKLPRVRQVAYVVPRAHKPSALQRVLDVENPTSAIVFCRTRLEVDSLVETLNAHGYRAEALHGGMQQRQREAVMGRFRAAKTDLLIATDVAARGLDVQQLSHVFNYDVPTDADAYVHRIGRTGRAGREGTAITLAEPREHHLLRTIERVTKQKLEIATVPTVADLKAKRLELTRASLHERLLAGNLDDVRVIVESLAREFDVLDVAAAAVKLAHEELNGDPESEVDLPAAAMPHAAPPRRGSPAGPGDGPPTKAKRHAISGQGRAVARLYFGAGRKAGIRPGDLVGAITNEAGLTSRDLGAIEITDRFSLVEVPEEAAEDVIKAMRRTTLRGEKVQVRRDFKDAAGAPPPRRSDDR
ncbi:MAG: DEAD/DEAH box helicase [Acidobacteriota bacterium]